MITPTAWKYEQYGRFCEYQENDEWCLFHNDSHPSEFFTYKPEEFRNIEPLYSVENVLDLLTDDKAREEFLAEFLNSC